MAGSYTNNALTVLVVISLVFACLWIKSKLWLTKSFSGNTPRRGDSKASILVFDFASMPMPDGDAALRPGIFVTKLEVWLRFANLPYTIHSSSPQAAPKGQLPYIKHGDQIVPDTRFIIPYLEATYRTELEKSQMGQLTVQEQAVSSAVLALLEDRVLYDVAYFRLIDDRGFQRTRALFQSIPWIMRIVIVRVMRVKAHQRLWLQGIGRHSEQDVAMLAQKHLQSVSAVLGNKPFLMGDAPCESDASLFAVLDAIIYSAAMSPEYKTIVRGFPNLCQFAKRIRADFFPEVQNAGKSGTSLAPGTLKAA